MNSVADLAGDGLEVINLADDSAFASRRLHIHSPAEQLEGMRRLTHAFVNSPETILQELVTVAVNLCGADSAGISIIKENGTDESFYHWVATAGQYSDFLNAVLPRYPSACGLCLERGGPQHFRVGQPFFDLLGVEAPLVTDGILLPWRVECTQGTIFVMAHGSTEAFDGEDLRVMQTLADFAAMAIRHQQQQRLLLKQAAAEAAAKMANELAHQLNNPLQSLVNTVYLAGQGGKDAAEFVQQATDDLARLAQLVQKLLRLPGAS